MPPIFSAIVAPLALLCWQLFNKNIYCLVLSATSNHHRLWTFTPGLWISVLSKSPWNYLALFWENRLEIETNGHPSLRAKKMKIYFQIYSKVVQTKFWPKAMEVWEKTDDWRVEDTPTAWKAHISFLNVLLVTYTKFLLGLLSLLKKLSCGWFFCLHRFHVVRFYYLCGREGLGRNEVDG